MRKAVLKKSGSRRRPRPARSRAMPPSNVTVLEGGKLRRFIRPDALAKASQKTRRDLTAQIMRRNDSIRETLQPYQPAPGVVPRDHKPPQMAMDDANINALVTWAQSSLGAYWTEGLTFMGYAELSNLTVRPEYRIVSQVIATECTRKWIAFQSTAENKMRDKERDEDGNNKESSVIGGEAEAGETNTGDDEHDIAARDAPDREAAAMLMQLQQARQDKQDAREQAEAEAREQRLAKMDAGDDKSERIKELVDEMDRLNVRDLMYRIVELDGWMGRAHLYIDTGATDDREELKTSIGDGRDEITKNKFQQGSLKRLAVIEPIWTYPQSYNASDPLREDWYNPSQWFVMGKELHATRLLTFIGRPVPDILKPAYSFGGLSLSQICKPYIDNWLQTRQSVNDIIHAFSVMVLQTDMGSVMQTSGFTMPQEGGDLFTRLDIFNMLRDNRGVFAIDKDSEDFKNVSAPLSSLDALQAQAQEHMASVSRIPLVKLLGISPHGLNATAEGELVAFYDTINAYQESVLRPNLTKVIHFAMMNLWGEIDEDITFKFEPLYALNEKEQAEVNKIKAETDDILINGCNALHPEEARKRVANEPDSPYEDIDITDVPEKPPEDSVNLKGSQPFEQGAQGEAGQENQPPGEEPPVGRRTDDRAHGGNG